MTLCASAAKPPFAIAIAGAEIPSAASGPAVLSPIRQPSVSATACVACSASSIALLVSDGCAGANELLRDRVHRE